MLAIESFRKGYLSSNPDQKADCDASIEEILATPDAFAVRKTLEDIMASMLISAPNSKPAPAPG